MAVFAGYALNSVQYLFMQDRSFQTWKKCKVRLQPSLNNADSHQPCQLENLCNTSDVSKPDALKLVNSGARQTELYVYNMTLV